MHLFDDEFQSAAPLDDAYDPRTSVLPRTTLIKGVSSCLRTAIACAIRRLPSARRCRALVQTV